MQPEYHRDSGCRNWIKYRNWLKSGPPARSFMFSGLYVQPYIRFAKCSWVGTKQICVSKCLITVLVKGWCILEGYTISLQGSEGNNPVGLLVNSSYQHVSQKRTAIKLNYSIDCVNHHGYMSMLFHHVSTSNFLEHGRFGEDLCSNYRTFSGSIDRGKDS